MRFDLLIRGGLVCDGSGGEPVRVDVGVRGGRIEEIGDLARADAAELIDAEGRIVSPGFIDVHSHSDVNLLVDPRATSKIAQGITTEVIGNCGASAAPRFGQRRLPADWEAQPVPATWRRMAEYLALLETARPSVNVLALVGHNALRGCIAGYDARALDPAEREALLQELTGALEEGAAGVSFGLAYSPGMFAPPEELRAVAAAAARRGAIVTVHLRSEGDELLESIREMLDLARATSARLQISHLKTSGPRNWAKIEPALEMIEKARAAGVDVAADRYPYTASATDLDVILPHWAAAGSRAEVLARLRDSTLRARIRAELMEERPSAEDWARIVIGSTQRRHQHELTGRTLAEIAEAWATDPADAALRLIEEDELATQAFFFGMSEANMWRILAQPWVMLGTDAGVRSPTGPLSRDHPHPRAYGTMPRFLRASLDGRTVPLPEAIRKMTALPAEHFRLADRGRIAKGCAADLVVFDPRRVADRADFATPHVLADGIDWVIVNGVPTWCEGRPTGRTAGRLLRRTD
ncbi:MAG: D-aminoacylase [Kiritimatiellae bacterium]|nr:D-aminoacylase [Kiritimatiellia bacterium]